jgi:hypothetical protein
MVDGRERCRCDCVVNQLGRVLLIGARIVYDGDAPGFLVRCTRQVGSTPGTCLYERWIETAKVVLRFPRDWLADWRTVAANSERLTANLRPSHRAVSLFCIHRPRLVPTRPATRSSQHPG